MKKKLIAFAVAMLALTGINASAQQNCQQCPGAEAGQCPGNNNKMYQPREITDFAFEGILLDVDQQAKMDTLNGCMKAAPGAKRHPKGRPQVCADSACIPMQGMGYGPEQRRGPKREMMRQQGDGDMLMPGIMYVAKVKEILTPEQFETFMTNISNIPCGEMQCPNGGPMGRMGNPEHHCMKEKGQCPNRGGCKQGECNQGGCKQGECKQCGCEQCDCKQGGCKQDCCKQGGCDKDKKKDTKDKKKDTKDKKKDTKKSKNK